MDIDEKFDVILVPSNQALVYVTQSGRPTIAVFGDQLAVSRPLTMSAWSNRLMLMANSGDEQLQVFYRPDTEGRPEVQLVDPRLSEFIPFLGHKTTVEKPYPGLGLSYGETIGAVHQLWRQSYIAADFKAEQDRILAAIIRSQKEEERTERPLFEPDESEPGEGEPAGTDASDLATVAPPPPVEVPTTGRDTVPR